MIEAIAVMSAVLLLTSCGADNPSVPEITVKADPTAVCIERPTSQPAEIVELPWTEEDVETMVLTLAGECYDDKPEDKRLVCEVILNRVSADGFGDTVLDVVSAPNQFNGYWVQSRETTENDRNIATQALKDWHDNDCKALSKYLFFCAGENRKNEFREEFE